MSDGLSFPPDLPILIEGEGVMEILGDKKFVEVPGSKTHELPPLLVRMAPAVRRLDRVMEMANDLIAQEDMLPPGHESAQMDLALNLIDQYMGFVQHWQWGDSILEWIRQCETTFDTRVDLRHLLRADLWPHAGRSSFVMVRCAAARAAISGR